MTIDLENWQAIGAGAGVAIVAIYNRWESRKTRKTAEKAVELSRPTGNGFAKKVTESLERIEAAQATTDKKLDEHIMAHANADVANRPRRILRDVNEL